MTTSTIEQLEKQIERLIREHIAACRLKAAQAVERAFASATPRAMRTSSGSRTVSRRRASDEISALGDRLYQAVCAQPGSVMATLAPVVGATARELNLPARLLKRMGRVRSVGERQATRYFPMLSKSTR
jgi:hypothetical protein